jgi:type VI secretion system lysozyme-like protein
MSSFYSVLTHRSDDIQENTLIEDIQTHLVSLLNARQYMISTNSEYGLPDLCSEMTGQYSTKILEAARELIQRYEPRLKIRHMICENPRVMHNQLRLKVIASIEESTLIEIEAKLGAQGLCSVTFV